MSTYKLLVVQKILARPRGVSSNHLFKTLEEWNQVLQGTTLAACLALNQKIIILDIFSCMHDNSVIL